MGMTFTEWALRQMLCLRHGCGAVSLYLDDGELQCHKCGIDFLRASVDDIMSAFRKNGAMQLADQGIYFEKVNDRLEVKAKAPRLDVVGMVEHWLKINGYDGLYHPDAECACRIGALDPGDCLVATCCPGYYGVCDDNCQGEHGGWHISAKRP